MKFPASTGVGFRIQTAKLIKSGSVDQSLGLFFRITSWLPPSTIEVEETSVSLAFC
jgi:hypothetical protein